MRTFTARLTDIDSQRVDATTVRVKERYIAEHGDRLYRVLTACHDSMAIARTPCMPFVKIFPEDFDPEWSAARHGLDPAGVRRAVEAFAGEQEIYQGWLGVRVFGQRPDIAELWGRAVLGAARRVRKEGRRLRLRLLLATITLPAAVTVLGEVPPPAAGARPDRAGRGGDGHPEREPPR